RKESRPMSYVKGLRCRECGAETPVAPLHVCETCFGPYEVQYDYPAIRRALTREKIAARPRNLWRYRELLPIEGEPRVGLHSGMTPLVRADRLAAVLGVKDLWVKDDSVNHPTFSYKDRVVSVAISKAIEFGFETVSCASTGNLANSVSAHAARAGLACYIFIPDDRELRDLGLVEGDFKIYTAQAAGCAPVVNALHKGTDLITPVKPQTIAKSIAIGNPADGFYVLKAVRESGGWGEAVTDEEIVAGIRLLARTEGIFTEPAGGTTVAVTKKLIEQGRIPRDESTVISVTGNGYKTLEAVLDTVEQPFRIPARLADFDELHARLNAARAASAV